MGDEGVLQHRASNAALGGDGAANAAAEAQDEVGADQQEVPELHARGDPGHRGQGEEEGGLREQPAPAGGYHRETVQGVRLRPSCKSVRPMGLIAASERSEGPWGAKDLYIDTWAVVSRGWRKLLKGCPHRCSRQG